jgi:hypothetical protein
LDLDHPGPGRHLSGPGVAVADNQAVAGGVELGAMSLEVGPALGQKRHRQHLLGSHPAELVEVDGHRLGIINHLRGGILD